jgi:hypothetical protein
LDGGDRRAPGRLLHRACRFRAAALWHLGGCLFGVVEVWLFMALIGELISPQDALIIEALLGRS